MRARTTHIEQPIILNDEMNSDSSLTINKYQFVPKFRTTHH